MQLGLYIFSMRCSCMDCESPVVISVRCSWNCKKRASHLRSFHWYVVRTVMSHLLSHQWGAARTLSHLLLLHRCGWVTSCLFHEVQLHGLVCHLLSLQWGAVAQTVRHILSVQWGLVVWTGCHLLSLQWGAVTRTVKHIICHFSEVWLRLFPSQVHHITSNCIIIWNHHGV